jgi:hypothetical protein
MNLFLSDIEMRFVKWYDYLWLLIPIAGIAMMVAAVLAREENSK